MEFRVTGLDGKVVVITGGARGMGAAYVRGFLAEGAKVVAADLSWDGVEVLRDEVKAAGGLPLLMDVTDNRAVDDAFAAVIDHFGTVEVLVNNAGMRQRDLYPPHGRVTTLETSDADWERMFAVNVFGALKVTRRFIQPMLERRRGSIINVCSSGILAHAHGGGYTALRPNSREMPYMASKAALATMCFYLADEVKAQNVAVNLILPGHTRTTGSDQQTRLRAAMGAANAAKMLVPEHVVPLVLYLASQDASQITGKLFDVVQWNSEHGLGGRERWEVPEERGRAGGQHTADMRRTSDRAPGSSTMPTSCPLARRRRGCTPLRPTTARPPLSTTTPGRRWYGCRWSRKLPRGPNSMAGVRRPWPLPDDRRPRETHYPVAKRRLASGPADTAHR